MAAAQGDSGIDTGSNATPTGESRDHPDAAADENTSKPEERKKRASIEETHSDRQKTSAKTRRESRHRKLSEMSTKSSDDVFTEEGKGSEVTEQPLPKKSALKKRKRSSVSQDGQQHG